MRGQLPLIRASLIITRNTLWAKPTPDRIRGWHVRASGASRLAKERTWNRDRRGATGLDWKFDCERAGAREGEGAWSLVRANIHAGRPLVAKLWHDLPWAVVSGQAGRSGEHLDRLGSQQRGGRALIWSGIRTSRDNRTRFVWAGGGFCCFLVFFFPFSCSPRKKERESEKPKMTD